MEYASRGVGTAGLTTGIIGSALGLINSGGLGFLGGGAPAAAAAMANSDNTYVNRYELEKEQTISELQSQLALRDANTYQDQKMLEMYKYVDGKFSNVEAQLCQQSVVNAQVTANIACMQGQIATLQGLTKTVVPIDNVCPQPMARYNAWEAPASSTATA